MINRRQLLRHAINSVAASPLLLKGSLASAVNSTSGRYWFDDKHQATLPKGAKLRIVASAGQPPVASSQYVWHGAPDGGECFSTANGGWIYVCNSELDNKKGGVGALRFDAQAQLVDSYPILTGTSRNCAGGRSLWGTWLSCEENGEQGEVYECDPYGNNSAVKLPALGAFNHEAVAMDPKTGYAYLTEDRPNGCLYRFRPTRPGDLSDGVLEVAMPAGKHTVTWAAVMDPSATNTPLRKQVKGAAQFKGGEGMAYLHGHIYFTTKIDNRVWSLNVASNTLTIIYDAATSDTPILTGVDNVAVSPNGELLIAEDGGDMQLVGLADNRHPVALVTLHGQDKSELTGPAFSPDGTKLYFNSQRGFSGKINDGITYELSLPRDLVFGSLQA